MKQIQIKSYGKINLCLDVLRRLENGYHEVEMVMQQILLHDDVSIQWQEAKESDESLEQNLPRNQNPEKPIAIEVFTNRPWLPTDERNLAYQAAMLMIARYGDKKRGNIRIDIKKRIPVAAGLAGGSGNGAAVLHGLNSLWDLGLDVQELCALGGQLGSDVPFSIMGQAKANGKLGLSHDPTAAHCAVARGTGTDLTPLSKGLKSHLVLTKPPMSISTAEVYQGLQLDRIKRRPDIDEMIDGLTQKKFWAIQKNMVNVLETFTLARYPSIMHTKHKVQSLLGTNPVLMSGSGPTIFALCRTREEAQAACNTLKALHKETFWTRTTY